MRSCWLRVEDLTVGREGEKGKEKIEKKMCERKLEGGKAEKAEIPIGWGWLEMSDPWSKERVWMKLPLEEIERRQAYQKRETAPRPRL